MNAENDQSNQNALPESSGAPCSVTAIPHKCPVCDGQGIISKPPWVAGDVNQWTSNQIAYPCKSCNGSGIIWGESQNGKVSDAAH